MIRSDDRLMHDLPLADLPNDDRSAIKPSKAIPPCTSPADDSEESDREHSDGSPGPSRVVRAFPAAK